MFIDDISSTKIRGLYDEIHLNPVKTARRFFPDKPKNYVKVTRLIGAYFINRFVALDLLRQKDSNWKKYAKIAADIYCDIPVWGRTIKDELL